MLSEGEVLVSLRPRALPSLDSPSRETELIPRRHHSRSEVQVVILMFDKGDKEIAVGSGDAGRIVCGDRVAA